MGTLTICNYLRKEGVCSFWWVVLGITTHVATTDILHGDVLDVETNVVSGVSLFEGLVVHLDGLHFSGHVRWSEGHHHTGLDDTSLDTTYWDRSDT